MQLSKHPGGPRHHYAPVFYLKQWAGPDGRLCEFSRPYKKVKPRRTHPDGTGYVRGLYTFSTLPPDVANLLEEGFLQRADDLACSALRRLLENRFDFTDDARSAWSRFILTLLHRNPEALVRLKANVAAAYPSYLQRNLAERHGSWSEYIPELSAGDIERLAFRGLHMIMDSQFLGYTLNSMIWKVLKFDDSHHSLLTSDRPIVMTNGLNKSDSHLALPISSRHLFVAANTQETHKMIEDMARAGGLAQRINNRMARQARKYVWGVDDSALSFIEPRLGEKRSWSPIE